MNEEQDLINNRTGTKHTIVNCIQKIKNKPVSEDSLPCAISDILSFRFYY